MTEQHIDCNIFSMSVVQQHVSVELATFCGTV